MKLITVHGNYVEKIDNRIGVFIKAAGKRGIDVIRLDPRKDNIKDGLVKESLFDGKSLHLIQHVQLLTKSDIELITSLRLGDKTVVLYSYKELSKRLLVSLGNDNVIEKYFLPNVLFKFLESFYPNNSQYSIKLFHETMLTTPVELVFMLLGKQARDMYWVKHSAESLPYPSWRVGKLKLQASKFDDGLLSEIINNLSEIDVESKTSTKNLKGLLDLTILTKLE